MFCQTLKPLFPQLKLFIIVFDQVENGEELYDFYKEIKTEESLSSVEKLLFNADHTFQIFLNPQHIISVYHVVAAVTRGFYRQYHGFQKTKTLHTEVISSLSMSSQISECFSFSSFQKTSQSILLACVVQDTPNALNKVNEISSYIHGHRLDPGKVLGSTGFFDKELIVKHFDISQEEQDLPGSIEAAVLSRLAVKQI